MNTLPWTCDQYEAVVNALDLAISKFDQNKKEKIALWITGFVQSHDCKKATVSESIKVYYRSFIDNINFNVLTSAFPGEDLGSAIDVFTSFQLTQYIITSNAFSSIESASSVLQLLETKNITFLHDFITNLPDSNYDVQILSSLLTIILTKAQSAQDPLCTPSLKALFQGKSSYIFKGINYVILDNLVLKDCSDYQIIFQGIDTVYDDLPSEIQQAVDEHREKFLNIESSKSGSACTYGTTSSQWLLQNIGKSINYFSYSLLITFNKNFDGYTSLEYLNLNQTIDLIIHSKLLTSESTADSETQMSALITSLKSKGYNNLKLFMMQLSIVLKQINIKVIVSVKIRYQFLQGIWGIMEEHFSQFTTNDWNLWYNEYLITVLPSITIKQLSVLSNNVVDDCSNMQTIVGGFDSGFGYMNEDSKSDVANWIIGFLRNDSSKCLTSGGDSLNLNFKQFKVKVSYEVIKELNPSIVLIDSLGDLSPSQIGEAVVTEQGALSNVSYIEVVFEVLTTGSDAIANLGAFWDNFVIQYEKVEEFTEEVKYKMLELTVDEIQPKFTTFTAVDFQLWFEKRLSIVTTVMNSKILAEFPLSADCDSYKSFVHALSKTYDETVPNSRQAVSDFLINFLKNGKKCSDTQDSTVSYIETSFGNYSVDMTYEELIIYYPDFNPYEEGVFKLLTENQIGDFMVVGNMYTSYDNTVKVVNHLQTLSLESVDKTFAQFTATAKKKNIEISVNVGSYMLEFYFKFLEKNNKIASLTHEEIKQMFQIRIFILIKFITVQNLQLFVISDCSTLEVIVSQLDTGFSSMSEGTKKDIAKWILGLLQGPTLKGCASSTTTSTQLVETIFKSFFTLLTIKEVVQIKPDFDVLSIISSTSVSQKVEIVTTGSVLQSLNTTMTVLYSLYGSDNVVSSDDLYTFLDEFNAAYGSLTVKHMTSEVKQEAMSFLFTSLISNMNSFTSEQISQFGVKFQYFITGITVETIEEIPLTMNCDTYKSIFSALSGFLNQFSEDISKAIFNMIIKYLQAQYNGKSDVCGSLYTSSLTYVQNIFFDFLEYATIYELNLYYSKFNVYDVVTKLSGKQLGNLLINTTAISDEFKAIQILVEVKKRDIVEVSSFMDECISVTKEKNIETLPNANIEKAIYTAVWDTISTAVKSGGESVSWFGNAVQLIIKSVSPTDIAELEFSDCDSQKTIVGSYGKSFNKLDDEQKKAVYGGIKKFNMDIKNTKGSACGTESGSSSDWLKEYVGAFVELGKVKEFEEANDNFNTSASLGALTGTQVATYAIESGALKSKEEVIHIYENIDTTQKCKDFLVQLNEAAPNDLKTSPYVDIIVSSTFEIISSELKTFTQENWTVWTQDILANVLFAVKAKELDLLPIPFTCESYHEVVKGFNKAYDDMDKDTKIEVYNKCMKNQLDKTTAVNGVKCGQQTQKTQDWLDANFGKFAEFSNFTLFKEYNVNFKGVEVIETLSPSQLGEVAVDSIEKEEVACQVASKVQNFAVQDAYSFLDSFSASFKSLKAKFTSKQISSKFLASSISAIKLDFSKYTASDWEDLMSVKLQPFLFSMDADTLKTMLDNTDCNGYNVVVKYLDSEFDNFSPETQQSLYGVLLPFLKNHLSSSGACPVNGEASSVTASRLFGKFKVFVSYVDLNILMPNFDGLQAIDSLSPVQKASLAMSGDILTDATKATTLANSLSTLSFDGLDMFLSSFQAIAVEKEMNSLSNPTIRGSLFNTIYGTVSKQFSSFTNEQWSNYWNFKLNLFLPSITETQIAAIPENINCNAFKSIISGLSKHYKELSAPVQKATCEKAKSYLKANSPASGPKCPSSSGGSGFWFEENFALFGEYITIQEITDIFPGFSVTDSIPYLTADQLGTYCANGEVLSDMEKIKKVMGGITSNTIEEFMMSFNAGLAANSITEISNAPLKKFLMGEILCKLGSKFSSFAPKDYSTWFSENLKYFTSSMDAKALGFIPSDIGCDSLAAIMKPLIALKNPENPEAIYSFVQSVLKNQLTSTAACTGDMTSKEWVEKYFGGFFIVGKWQDIVSLSPHFDVTSAAQYMSQVQLAEASASTSIISNSTALTTLLFSFSGSLEDFYGYMDTLQTYFIKNPSLLSNTKVRDSLLMFVAQYVFANMDTFDIDLTTNWMNKINFLLPGINATMLELVPGTISCEQYQAIVSALNGVYQSLSISKRTEVAAFQKKFLKAKHDADNTCTDNNVLEYLRKNIGYFCKQFNAEDIALFNNDIDAVSLTNFCSLS
ncbi:hypothetical protein GDO81_027359 [Engystomops pustulosus]|uniref:Uncharacterized protein n=1 Tax=Engystomops pustulosus TaxID=76066 RepID=A0AAV6ZEN8_ENGPU|nr:hypothetical protein GDO81_027359 [Engystomops pustulosus]